MALSSAMEFDVQTGGSDSNGGGFKSGASGSDYSLSTTPHVVIDGATISCVVHSTTTQLNVTGYTVAAGDVGNVVQNVSGSATAGFYEITVADTVNNRWTVDKSAGTAAQTFVGNMGGCLLSPGKALSVHVSGNKIWVKFGTYNIASTSYNIAGGALNLSTVSSQLRGYDVTHGDLTGNRPTFKATVNSIQPVVKGTSTGQLLGNFIIDADVKTGIYGMLAPSDSTTYYVKANKADTTAGINCNTSSVLYYCEATNCTTVGIRSAGVTAIGCVAYNNTTGFESAGDTAAFVECIADSNSSTGFMNDGASSSMLCHSCSAYNNNNGFDDSGTGFAASCTNCVAHSNGTKGFGATMLLAGCAAGNHTTNFAAADVQISNITLTAIPFTNAGSHDFSLNATAGGGTSCKGAGVPAAFPSTISTTSYPDIGAAQSQATTTVTGGGANISMITGGNYYLE